MQRIGRHPPLSLSAIEFPLRIKTLSRRNGNGNRMCSWLSKDNFLAKRSKHLPNLDLAMLLALSLLSAGCVVSTPSEPGAENVALTHKEADVASCTVLGNVVGLTDTNYVRDERREMQNQAVGLGGDTILLTRDRDPPKGTAYRCKAPATEEHH
jgi:hypothetical protein